MRIAIAIDQTNNWEKVVDHACTASLPKDSEFKILTVLKPLSRDVKAFFEHNSAALENEPQRRRHANAILKKAREKLIEAYPLARVHSELRNGVPAVQVLESVVQWMPDKLFVGAHKLEPNRLLPGAISRAVSAHDFCHIEIVRLKND